MVLKRFPMMNRCVFYGTTPASLANGVILYRPSLFADRFYFLNRDEKYM